jgi:hypothetical protein
MNPYILQGQPMQDLGGLQPVFQNFGQQQANQQAALAQQNQLVQQAGQTQGGGMNPLAMAMMLRAKDPKKPNYDGWQTSGDNTYFGSNSNGMGAGQGYSGMNAELGLGS